MQPDDPQLRQHALMYQEVVRRVLQPPASTIAHVAHPRVFCVSQTRIGVRCPYCIPLGRRHSCIRTYDLEFITAVAAHMLEQHGDLVVRIAARI